MSETQYLRSGTLSLGAVVLGGFAADYAFNLGLTRFLTPEGYGDFKVAYAFAFFFGLAVLLGGDRAAPMVLGPCLARGESRKAWEYLRFYLGNALLLSLGLVAVVWTASYLHVGKPHPVHHHPLAWIVIAVPLNAIAAMVSRTLQSARMPAKAALPWRIGLPLLQLVILGLAFGFQGTIGIEEAVGIAILVTALLTLWQWRWVRQLELVEVAREPEFHQPREWLSASLPMMGSFLVALALNQSDLYFLELLGEEAEVGHYAAAATVAHLVMLVQTTVIGLVAPLTKQALEDGPERSEATFRQARRLMLTLTIPVTLLVAGAAGPVLHLFGPEYGVARTTLVLLAVGNCVWAIAALSNLWMQYQNRAGVVLTIALITLGVDSGLNLLLIPRYGMTGAAAGTAATLSAAGLAAMLVRGSQGRVPGR